MGEIALDYQPLIRDMPLNERPRERMRLRGAGALSNAELLAILLRTGSVGENVIALAIRLIAEFEGLEGLGRAGFAQLCAKRAMGEAKAAQVVAAMELGRRAVSTQPGQRMAIRSCEDVYALVGADMAMLEQEHLRVILLDNRNRDAGVRDIYKGNVHSAVVRVAEVFRDAVREGRPGLIVVHNHPSGDPTPSTDDIALTKQMLEAGRLLGVELVDHVVIGRTRAASLKDLRLGFPSP